MFGRIFKVAFLICISFIFYLIIYPNDFFLSHKPFKKREAYHFEKCFNHFIIYDINKVNLTLSHLIKHPEEYLKEEMSFIKNNKKRTIAKLNLEGKKIIIKRYNFTSWFDWITKCPFRSSKAYRYWYYAHLFKDKGIDTVNPIAVIEKRIGPLWIHTYLIMEYHEGKTLNELKEKNLLNSKKSTIIAEQLQNTLQTFNELNWLHPDFKDKNILVTDQVVAILDLDELHAYTFNNHFYKKKSKRKHLALCP